MEFDYAEPTSVEDALAALVAAPDTHLIAGGTDLMRRVRTREANPARVVGISRLPELQGIDGLADGGLRIGAAVTLGAIARSALVRTRAPLLAEVCGGTRTPQARTLATLGGELCGVVSLAEPPLALFALGGRVRLRSAQGERTVALDDFFPAGGKTALAPDEVLTDVFLPPLPSGARTGYAAESRRGGIEPPLAASAVSLSLDGAGDCRAARVTLGAATPQPTRLAAAEAALIGSRLDEPTIRAAAALAGDVEPRADDRARRDYLRRLAAVVVRRAIEQAVDRGTRE